MATASRDAIESETRLRLGDKYGSLEIMKLLYSTIELVSSGDLWRVGKLVRLTDMAAV